MFVDEGEPGSSWFRLSRENWNCARQIWEAWAGGVAFNALPNSFRMLCMTNELVRWVLGIGTPVILDL